MDIYFYYADKEYINFLKEAEKSIRGFTCVPNVSYGEKEKFVFGAVLEINEMKFYVPVSSYSKQQQDNILIKDKKGKSNAIILGSLRFTYMIPIPSQCCKKVDISSISNVHTKTHIVKELKFCQRNRDKIFKQAEKTYLRVKEKKYSNLIRNSCDFEILERAYYSYCIRSGYINPDEYFSNGYLIEIKSPDQLTALKSSGIPFQKAETSDGTIIVKVKPEHKEAAQNAIRNAQNGQKR